jgi:hypothetical protein
MTRAAILFASATSITAIASCGGKDVDSTFKDPDGTEPSGRGNGVPMYGAPPIDASHDVNNLPDVVADAGNEGGDARPIDDGGAVILYGPAIIDSGK